VESAMGRACERRELSGRGTSCPRVYSIARRRGGRTEDGTANDGELLHA